MTCDLVGIIHDAAEPARLAFFWASLLDREVSGATVRPDGDLGPWLRFVATSESKIGLNRIHFDLTSSSPEHQRALVARALELGGQHLDIGQGPDVSHVVLADPEGNEFCVIEPVNEFLAGTGSLGAVNCDGTRAVGQFWSTALGWPLVWDQDEETAIQSPNGGPKVTWSGPPLMPRHGRDRLRFEISASYDERPAEIECLVALGASLVEAPDGDGPATLTDPDGNEFTLLRGRASVLT